MARTQFEYSIPEYAYMKNINCTARNNIAEGEGAMIYAYRALSVVNWGVLLQTTQQKTSLPVCTMTG